MLPPKLADFAILHFDMEIIAQYHKEYYDCACFDLVVRREDTFPQHDHVLFDGLYLWAGGQSDLFAALSEPSLEDSLVWVEVTTRQHPRIRVRA